MKKTCEYCKNEFETLNLKKRCCSYTCSAKMRWKSPEERLRQSVTQQKVQNTFEMKEKYRTRENKPGVKENKSRLMKEHYNKPGVRKAHSIQQKEIQNRTEIKIKKSISEKLAHNKPETKEKIKLIHNSIEYKEKMSKALKEHCNKPGVKEKMSQRSLENWRTPEYIEKRTNALLKGRFKYKEFTLPSGKMVKLQGYEPQVLIELLRTLLEEDIIIGAKNIREVTGLISYIGLDNRVHTYIPDFYIKSNNTIIEVKSKWTFEKDKEKNLLKQQACLSKGFNFEFKIL